MNPPPLNLPPPLKRPLNRLCNPNKTVILSEVSRIAKDAVEGPAVRTSRPPPRQSRLHLYPLRTAHLEGNPAMELWTGLACLVADPNCKEFRRFGDDGKGAYVNVVAWASSEENFVERVKQVATTLDCIVLEMDGTQLLDSRMREPDYPDELITMRTTAQRQPDDTIFGCFHVWVQSDVN